MIGVRDFSSYVSHWTNSKSRRNPLAGIVRSGSLRRVTQVITSLIKEKFGQNYQGTLNAHTKLAKSSSPCLCDQELQGPLHLQQFMVNLR